MRKFLRTCFHLALWLAAAGLAGNCTPTPSRLPLTFVADIPLPGGTSRFDYESLDPNHHLLFIAHLGADSVVVFNTQKRKVVAVIPNLPSVHGVLVVPSIKRIYASATGENRVAAIDESSLRILARIPAGDYPDGMAYDPLTKKLYVSDEFGRTETVIDTQTNRRLKTIPLGGEAGNSQYNPIDHRVYVNVQTLNQLVAIDPDTDTIVARYPIPRSCEHDHSLLIAPDQMLAFVACEGNAKLAVFSLKTKRFLPSVFSVGQDPDVLAFDPSLRRLYVASESGVLAVFQVEGTTLHKLGLAYLAYRAHSIAVNPQTREVYLPLQNVNGRAVLRILHEN
ncbi:MAG TPA: YncE family protein [Chthonomonas sp.]|uniref:YncE family protein n=1 Tax=Chthonomonas sp. TaxID=2282153 RepID=UPI002B4B84A4|nr:YncE family protein [Chthonomonas sp.]HLI49252.1 YncE family protein [Chthonomonas sp.]